VRIFVDSTPHRAVVERNGKRVGITPYFDMLQQGTKSIRYRILMKGYKPFEEALVPDRKRSLTAKLKPEPKT
jgi:hypothetical protein